jgi:hypothetical protein
LLLADLEVNDEFILFDGERVLLVFDVVEERIGSLEPHEVLHLLLSDGGSQLLVPGVGEDGEVTVLRPHDQVVLGQVSYQLLLPAAHWTI